MEDELAQTPGVTSTEVGYIGGNTSNPTYEQVCSGRTGHTEAVRVRFDNAKTNFKALVKAFFELHNPYSDVSFVHGGQYKSAVFYLSPEQKKEALEVAVAMEKQSGRRVTTKIEAAGTFWRAEEYHQQYYQKNHLGTCRAPSKNHL